VQYLGKNDNNRNVFLSFILLEISGLVYEFVS